MGRIDESDDVRSDMRVRRCAIERIVRTSPESLQKTSGCSGGEKKARPSVVRFQRDHRLSAHHRRREDRQ